MATVYEEEAKVFKAFCDERRLRILELLQNGIGQNRELLVGGRGHRELISQGGHTIPQAVSHPIGVAGNVEIQADFQPILEHVFNIHLRAHKTDT